MTTANEYGIPATKDTPLDDDTPENTGSRKMDEELKKMAAILRHIEELPTEEAKARVVAYIASRYTTD